MKQLVCEMCGGTDLIKDGGVFVCQTCGCKYSIEEARKMMVEGTVDVKGTVRIDKSSEADKILKNADATYSDGNHKEAFDLYSQALSIDPDNAHAIMRRAISSAWQSSVKDCKITEINRAAERAYSLKHEQCGDTKEYFAFCLDTALEIAPLINAISNMYINYYNKARPRTGLSISAAIMTADLAAEVKDTMELGEKNCCVVAQNVVTYILNGVSDFAESSEELWNTLQILIKNCKTYRSNANMSPDPSLDNVLKQIEEKAAKAKTDIEARKQAKRNEYWAEHANERADLEDRKETAKARQAELMTEMAQIPELAEKQNMDARIESLTKQMNALGLFKGKEKKALQSQIDEIRKELTSVEGLLNDKKQAIQTQLDEQAAILAEIESELTRDR